MLKGTPPWANGGRDPSWAPNVVADYASFVRAAARRYPSVRHWMIWGETDSRLTFNPLPDNSPTGPRRYAKLLDAAYGQLKAQNRRNVVIGAMTHNLGQVRNSDELRWLRLPDGRLPRMDWWGHNTFSPHYPDLRRGPLAPGRFDFNGLDTFAKQVQALYRRAGRTAPRIWVSEFTISSDRANSAFAFFVSRAEQARWVTAAYRQVDAHPEWFAGLGWFGLLDGPASDPHSVTTGLMTLDGARKPAFYAYAARCPLAPVGAQIAMMRRCDWPCAASRATRSSRCAQRSTPCDRWLTRSSSATTIASTPASATPTPRWPTGSSPCRFSSSSTTWPTCTPPVAATGSCASTPTRCRLTVSSPGSPRWSRSPASASTPSRDGGSTRRRAAG